MFHSTPLSTSSVPSIHRCKVSTLALTLGSWRGRISVQTTLPWATKGPNILILYLSNMFTTTT